MSLLNYKYGWNLTIDELIKWAKEILKLEANYNLKTKFTKRKQGLPTFFSEEELPVVRRKFDIHTNELENLWH